MEALVRWFRGMYAWYKIKRFLATATEEEISEWHRELLMECRQQAFRDKDYELVGQISDVLDEME